MMKLVLGMIMAGLALTGAAEAKKNNRKPASKGDFVCKQEGEDGVYVATFSKDRSKVTLSVPEGESSAKTYSGTCKQQPGAIELSLLCNVRAGMEDGYDVTLASPGGARVGASVTHWTMAGKEEPEHLKCPPLND